MGPGRLVPDAPRRDELATTIRRRPASSPRDGRERSRGHRAASRGSAPTQRTEPFDHFRAESAQRIPAGRHRGLGTSASRGHQPGQQVDQGALRLRVTPAWIREGWTTVLRGAVTMPNRAASPSFSRALPRLGRARARRSPCAAVLHRLKINLGVQGPQAHVVDDHARRAGSRPAGST